ncbi:MAG: protein kinase [Anaerolineales bacterium]|nr:protein kinase [Anaerolineales bacterium]
MLLERDILLHNRYRIQGNLGQGGMGSVYLAVDENLGVQVAVKENLFTTEEYARQFRLEAVILANIRHPNLPRVSDHFVIAGEGQYLIMDFIDGEDLRQRMERVGVLDEDEVIQIGAAMCDALSYLHARKPSILHRDIKPGNVKISPDGHIFLVDFGLAKMIQGNQATTTGARAMTPGYSPPEQYGTARTDSRTDIYSLGATLYAALTGVIPEDGLARAMDSVQLTPVRKRKPEISRRLAAAIEKAMEVDPSDRFQTADEFKLALLNSKSKTQQLLGTYTVAPPPATEEGRQREFTQTDSSLATSKTAEEYEFVSPRKKQRDRRARLSIFGATMAILFAALAGIVFLFPALVPEAMRQRFLPPSISAPVFIPLTTAQVIEVTPANVQEQATSTLVIATPQTQVVTVNPDFEPTPIGADYLEIAYASNRTGVAQIYLTNILEDQARQITNMLGGACQPSWSPDGMKLVFTSPCDLKKDMYPQSNLYIMNMGSSELTPIPFHFGGDFEPAWSPDGKSIAFTSLRDGYMQIYSYNVETKVIKRLTETVDLKHARQPCWSPDGKKIVYAYKRIDTYEIWAMSNTGANQERIYFSGSQLSDYQPIWSADGKFILFNQQKLNPPQFEFPTLFSLQLGSGKVPVQIFLGVRSIEDVDYSSGGVWMAYEGGGTSAYHIYYSTPSGGGQSRITEGDIYEDFDPAWRPLQKTTP